MACLTNQIIKLELFSLKCKKNIKKWKITWMWRIEKLKGKNIKFKN